MIKNLLIIFFLLSTFLLNAEFENSYSFLDIQESGVAEINSGSGVSTIIGLFSIYGNPAGFAAYNSQGILISDTENPGDIRKFGLFYGSAMKYFNYITGVKYFYLKNPIQDTINYNAFDVNFLLSKKFFNILSSGITLKYIYSKIYTYTASLVLINAGVSYKIKLPMIFGKEENFIIGLYFKDMGFVVKNYNSEEPITCEINGGVRYLYVKTGIIESSILFNYNNKATLSAGINFKIFRLVETGFFYKMDNSNNYIFGNIGVKFHLKNFYYGFYYTIEAANEYGNIHSISISIEI